MALRELLATFGVEVDDGQLKGFDANLKATTSTLGKLGKALLGGFAAKAVVGFIADTAAMGAEIDDLSTKLGITADDVQQFQYVVGQSGGSAELAAKGLSLLTKNLGMAVTGNAGAAKGFADLGLSIKNADGSTRSITELLPEISDKIADTDDAAKQAAMAVGVFGKAGLELLPTLKQGADGIREQLALYKDLGLGLGGDFIKAAAEADDQFDNLRQQWKAVKAAIMVNVLPPITAMTKSFLRMVGAMIQFDKQTHIVRQALAGFAAFGAFKAAKSLYQLASPMWGAIKAFRAMGVTIFGASVPLWLIIGALLLLYLAVDDIFALMRGDKSVIGEYLDAYGGAGTAAALVQTLKTAGEELSASFASLGPILNEVFGYLKDAVAGSLPSAVTLFVGFTKAVLALGVALAAAFSVLYNGIGFIKNNLKLVGQFLGGASFEDQLATGAAIDNNSKNLVGAAMTAGQTIFGKDQFNADGSISQVGGIYGDRPAVPMTQLAGPPVAPTSLSTEVKTNVYIEGAKDPKAVAIEVAKTQGDVANQANQDAANALASHGQL